MNSEMLKGHLDMLLLAVVRDRPAHGYALIEELAWRSGGAFDLPEGTVYPALHRLERAGLLASRWSSETRRQRRVYEITDAGRAALQECRGDWRRFARAVEAVVQEAAAACPT